MSDLRLQCLNLKIVCQLAKLHVFLQRLRLKQVVCELSSVSSLRKPKHQVNPFVQVCAHIVAFKRKPIFKDKVLVARGPIRQSDIFHFVLQMVQTKLGSLHVLHERAVAKEKLRNQLFVVSQNIGLVLPRQINIMENLIGWSSD